VVQPSLFPAHVQLQWLAHALYATSTHLITASPGSTSTALGRGGIFEHRVRSTSVEDARTWDNRTIGFMALVSVEMVEMVETGVRRTHVGPHRAGIGLSRES
jgi:hypothetical protein